MQFSLSHLPRIEFGCGVFRKLPDVLSGFGRHFLIVCGARSFQNSRHWGDLQDALLARTMTWRTIAISGEPAPELIDQTVARFRSEGFDAVVGIGGGSALDAAKAIAGLLKPGNSVMDHLEGVGPELAYRGPATPFVAVPTTAGTGSEATKNAVLSMQGETGFKKSFRDEKLMAEYALVDPDLLLTCPMPVIAANGMDAFTQLLESFVSTKATPLSDALAISGMTYVRDSLLPWFEQRESDTTPYRSGMAYAALLSGITLAHVGLGCVHGLASPLGAFFPIPHGVVCGTLLAEATRINLEALRTRTPDSPALEKYARTGRMLAQREMGDDEAVAALLEALHDWTQRLALPRLGKFGVTAADLPRIVAHSRGSSMKTNPVLLRDDEIAAIVRARL